MRMLGDSRFSIEDIINMTSLLKGEIEQLDGERVLEAETSEKLSQSRNYITNLKGINIISNNKKRNQYLNDR
jgi:hypothetical protein